MSLFLQILSVFDSVVVIFIVAGFYLFFIHEGLHNSK